MLHSFASHLQNISLPSVQDPKTFRCQSYPIGDRRVPPSILLMPACYILSSLVSASPRPFLESVRRRSASNPARPNPRIRTVDVNSSPAEIVDSFQSTPGPLKHTVKSGHLHRSQTYHQLFLSRIEEKNSHPPLSMRRSQA